MTSSLATEISYLDDVLAGSSISLVCVTGAILMILVIIGSYRIPSMKSSFGFLTINQNLAEMVACIACFYLYFFGYTLNYKIVLDNSYIVGRVIVIMLYIIILSFLMISFNRLCAIAFPITYTLLFRKNCLLALLLANWSIPFFIGIYLMIFKHCNYIMFHYGWSFNELKNEICGPRLTIFISLQVVPVFLTVLTDVFTLLLLLILRNHIYKMKSAETKKRELNFARQILVQGTVFLMHGFCYQKGRTLMPEMPENWKIFWTTSFASNLIHVFDPIIVFACNLDFRAWLLAIGRKNTTTRVTAVIRLSSSMN